MECVATLGPAKTSLAEVASALGVTRQTVYRYFPSTEMLLAASADVAAVKFLECLADHVADLRDPVEILAEAIVYILERLPQERYLGLLIAEDRQAAFASGINAKALDFAEALLRQFPIDWDAAGYGQEDLRELAEFMLRLFLSFAQPSEQPQRDGVALRAYLRRWLGPDIAALPLRELSKT
jgi:AcrR family transcriptional regulator